MDGWIKTHRSLLDWEWHTDPNMVSLWMHLLVLANFEDKRWKGMVIKRGQLVTSVSRLSETTGISQQSLRTCLAKLEQTQEINKQTTNKFTIITILKYDSYQQQDCCENGSANKQLTNNQQTTNKQLTTTKERKNNINNNINSACARVRLESSTVQNSLWLDQTAMNLRTTEVAQLASEVMDGWEISQIPEDEWTAYHLVSGMRKLLQIRKTQARPTKADEKAAWRAQMMQSIKNDLTNNGNPTQ